MLRARGLNLGRLKSVGVNETWKVPLYLPTGFIDCRNVYENFGHSFHDSQQVVVIGKYIGDLVTEWRPSRNGGKRTPFSKASILDGNGRRLKFSLFGDARGLEQYLKDHKERVSLTGTVTVLNGIPFLNNPSPIAENDIGRIVPVYPGKAKVLSPDNARRTIAKLLDQTVPLAAEKLRSMLSDLVEINAIRDILKCRELTLEQVLYKSHYPESFGEAEEVHKVLERIAALISVADLRESCAVPEVRREPIEFPEWRSLLTPIPFTLTSEQMAGVEHLMDVFSKPYTSNTLINADVGMGKSIIYQVAIAAVVKAGGRAAVLLPNERLAQQAYQEISSFWPELNAIQVNKKCANDLTGENLLVGTTALLFRDIGHLDVCITDEQHRFSVDQRKHLANDRTHIIELSATPIPRTQAMLVYGSVNVIRLTKRHCEQNIETRIIQYSQARTMVDHVMKMVSEGDRLLIVCPRKEMRQDEDEMQYSIPSVSQVAEKWERLFPGEVRVVHSQTPDEKATQNIEDIKSGKAHILVSTTVIECGITIEGLRALIVVHAERFGIAQLHQLRGRLSRHGGYGVCYLYIPKPVKESTMNRLNAVASTNDGFELSELDMQLRGVGDLSKAGNKQHGSADSIIFNKQVSVGLLAEMLEVLPT